MKTKTTIKQAMLALTIALSIVSCKKDPDPTPPTPAQTITFTDLKALSTGASVKIPDGKKITGIVISDVSSKNIDSKTVILQEATDKPGIILTFDAAQTFALGDQLEVIVSNQTLAQVNGEIEITNVPAVNATKIGTGTIAGKATTTAAIATNKAAWNGTLVTISATELSGGNGKFTGSLTIKDAAGTVKSNVLAGAPFENTAYPVSVTSVMGIVRISGADVHVDIRKAADVVTGAITRVVTEDFSNVTALSVSPGDLPNYIGGNGFTTAAGSWNTDPGSPQFIYMGLMPGSQFDSDFTSPARTYVYTGQTTPSGTINGASHSSYNNLVGVKQVSVTFAGSKMSGTVFPYNSSLVEVKAFDASQDYFQIGLLPSCAVSFDLLKLSPQYNKASEFNTMTYIVPTKDELVASGIDPATADDWLKRPNFYFINYSIRTADQNQVLAPILYDKIVFGFDK